MMGFKPFGKVSKGATSAPVQEASTSQLGIVRIGDGLTSQSGSGLSVKVGAGLKIDAAKNVAVDAPAIDVTQLNKADTLVSGVYRGGLNATSNFTTLANAQKGNWWNVSAAVTIGGQAFGVGDQLWCSANVAGTPANLTNFVRVPATMAQATTTAAGIVQLSGDLGGTAVEPLVKRLGGVTLPTAAPKAGQVLSAQSATATEWVNATQSYVKTGFDFTVSASPSRFFRGYLWCSSAGGASVSAANVPWVVANQADADRLAAYWLQQLATFFKNLENDTQYDQLIGHIPVYSGITEKLQSGTIAVNPSTSTDMDNVTSTTMPVNYAAEWFELVVAANAAGTELYTMWFNLALVITNATSTGEAMYPFRMVYQTTQNQQLSAFPTTPVASISGNAPKTTVRSGSFTAPSAAFLICAEPVSIECRR